MANIDRPNGLRPYKDAVGRPYNGQYVKMYSAVSNLFLGDVVIAETAGNLKYQACARATSATATVALGVVVGWEPNPTSLGNLYHVASDVYAVYICTDPFMSYIVQGDGVGTIAINDADTGMLVDYAIAAGDTATGASNFEVDESTTGVTTIATPLLLLGFQDSPDNEVGVANQKMIVKINMHAYGNLLGETTGV